MPFTPLQFAPGTTKTPMETEVSSLAFTDTNGVHFPDGKLRTVDPWADTTPINIDILGGARTVFGHINSLGVHYLFGTNTHLYVNKNGTYYNITPLKTTSTTLGSNPLATTSGSAVVVVTHTAHGFADGDRIKLDGVGAAVNGIPQAELEAEHIITYIGANSYSITVTTTATSTGSGGGASVVIYGQIDSGNLDVELGSGYGLGLYGVGLYGVAKTSTTNLFKYPRIWSFDGFGNDIVMCPGDYAAGDGQKIYIWDGDTDTAPTVLTNAPTDCNFVFVYNNAVTALCANRVDISETGDATVWTPGTGTNAYSTEITRIVRLTSGIRVGEYALLFSANECLLLRWVGEPDYYIVDDLSQSDGIIAPNAVCVLDQVAYWQGARGRYKFNRAGVERLNNIQNEDWELNNINYSQAWKSFAVADTKHNQVWFYYPLADSDEPNRYNIFNLNAGHWTLGMQSRTGAMRNGFVNSTLFMVYGDSESNPGSIYTHFLEENPSLSISPYAETSFGMLGEGDYCFRIDEVRPDTYQQGDISLTLTFKEYAQSTTEYSSAYTLSASEPYISTRDAGRVRKYRIEQNSAGAYFTMGDWKESITQMGRR